MPHCAKIANVLAAYSAALDDLRARVQQDRSIHCQELLNVYSEAVATGANRAFIEKVTELLAERMSDNDKKVRMDALEWEEHEHKTSRALGSDAMVMRGGARGMSKQHGSKSRKTKMRYCGCRCNAYHTNLLKKLMHDRATHAHELRYVVELAGGMLGADAPMTEMVSAMAREREKYNSRKTRYDARLWRELADKVKGGGCKDMLTAGGGCCA